MKKKEETANVTRLEKVTKIFHSNFHRTVAVHNVSLEMSLGELTLLLGPSGSGKTTLLTLIAGLIAPTDGVVNLFGKNITQYGSRDLQRTRATRLGFVFQNFLLIDALTASRNVSLVQRFGGRTKKEAEEHSLHLLVKLGIEHLANKFPSNLSQGEKQRVAMARAIANDPELILADEPTANLDTRQGLAIIRLLHQFAKKEHKCVVVASHDLRIEKFADRVVRLRDGEILSNYRKVF